MKIFKKSQTLLHTAFASGIAAFLAGCVTTQGSLTGAQLGEALGRVITGAPLQASATAPTTSTVSTVSNMRQTMEPVNKQQVKPVSLSTAGVPGTGAPVAATSEVSVSYQELVKFHTDDSGDPRKAYGKTVQVAVTGKGDIGYFANRSDGITFVCKTGDKALTALKATKNRIRGLVVESQPWEGATVYKLKDCQFVKANLQ